jgi:signal transduction histidine kinase/ABC-type amino acid transport substrate-binding protein
MKQTLRRLILLTTATLLLLPAAAQSLTDRYNKQRPVTIVCDWDKPPYEFADDEGQPAGSNVDVLRVIMEQIDLPCQFVMKEWSNALKTFERGDADLILANVNRFRSPEYYATQIINYNRIRVAMTTDTTGIISLKTMEKEGVTLKSGDFSAIYFRNSDTTYTTRIEYQSPKVALTGLLAGDNKYFVWGEEPLKWKIRKLGLTGIYLNDVSIPVSEVHIIGRDRELIDQIDDQFSRLKQSGELEKIRDTWFHPERHHDETSPVAVYVVLALLLLTLLIIVFYRLAKAHVRSAWRSSSELNNMMIKALHMGNYDVMEYDIRENRITNLYGDILPEGGLTFEEFTARIHPDQQQEFLSKTRQLLSGRSRRFELEKRWNAGTPEAPHWLNFHGHAILELDAEGHPAYVVNAIHDVTHEMEEDRQLHEQRWKSERLAALPYGGLSFYNREGWLLSANEGMKQLCGFAGNSEAERYWKSLNIFDIPLFRDAMTADGHDTLQLCQHLIYPEMGIDRYIELDVMPLHDADGEIVNYFYTAVDKTADREATARLIRMERDMKATTRSLELHRRWLDFLLSHSGRYISSTEGQARRISTDTTALCNARRRLEELTAQANDSNRMKSGFMASMTHELRTPLNAIVGFTGVLDALGESPERSEYVRVIRNSSDMLQRLINDIIEASVITDGPTTLMPTAVNFAQAFDDICMTLQQRVETAATPGVVFLKDNPCQSLPVTLDIGRIQQVLTNFVTNAIKFTRKGHIRVGYRVEHDALFLYCEDTGIGIDKGQQDIVFDRFVKLDEFVQGTGMGLAICKSIAERCGATIGVDSEGAGHGSTFWLRLPL